MSKSFDAAFRDEAVLVITPPASRRIEIKPSLNELHLEKTIKPSKALDVQVGGSHYKGMKIQPIEFAIANDLDFFQKDVIKYVTRKKGDLEKRLEDLNKAKHYIDLYMDALKGGY